MALKRTPVKTVPECLKNRAPPLPAVRSAAGCRCKSAMAVVCKGSFLLFKQRRTTSKVKTPTLRPRPKLCRKNQDRNYKELQSTIEYMEKRRSRHLETMEGKEKLKFVAPEEVQMSMFQDVVNLDRVISAVESELREAED